MSPRVSTEELFITSVIEAIENQDVAVNDIPGGSLSTDMEKVVNINLQGELALTKLKLAPVMYHK